MLSNALDARMNLGRGQLKRGTAGGTRGKSVQRKRGATPEEEPPLAEGPSGPASDWEIGEHRNSSNASVFRRAYHQHVYPQEVIPRVKQGNSWRRRQQCSKLHGVVAFELRKRSGKDVSRREGSEPR